MTALDFYDWQADEDMGNVIHGRFPHHQDDDDGAPLQEIDVRAFRGQGAAAPSPVDAPPVASEAPAAPGGLLEQATDAPASGLPVAPARSESTPPAVEVDEQSAPAFTRRAFRHVARHGLYVAHGARLARQARRDANGTDRFERMMRAAEAVGDHQAAREWATMAAEHRQARHERRIAMRTHPVHVARKSVTYTGLTASGLLTLGVALAITNHTGRDVFRPLIDACEAIGFAFSVVTSPWVFAPAILATPAYVVAHWWMRGRHRAELPVWLMTAAQREKYEGAPITPSSLVTALRDLGHAELRKIIKGMGDAGAALLGPIVSAGCGIEVDIYLPGGVSTAEIQARRQKLAENLGRHRHELFITIPERAHTVRLWIADSGALDEPIGPSPLVTDPTIKGDYFRGRAPWGQSLRGDRSTVSLFQRHILVAGISNQGKTASLRALILWLALDPRVRIWLADFKGVGDWGMFKGIAEVLIQGPTDEHVMAGTHMAEAGVVEMQKRTTLMQELTDRGWSQEKILADPRFAPLVLVFDEAQKAYGCGAIGEDKRPYGGKGASSRYFQAIKAIHDQGRAVNVQTAEGVQDPTNENLPVRTREGNHIRCSLVVGTESQSVMALGENAVNAGAAPHELRQGADKGTLVIAGDITAFDAPSGQVYTTIRTHYIGAKDAAAIADRARALRKGGVETADGTEEPAADEERDVLADIAEVLHGERVVRTEEVVHRLKVLSGPAYGEWTTRELTAALRGTPGEVYKTSGAMHVGLARIQEAIAERENESGAAENDGPAA
jgi:S-DNA-T family DNA segregation ATPase FtsK/SpoIIIE